jgi:hypothetical protein
MKKLIGFMIFLGITAVNAQRTDFGVYTINAPAAGATLHQGAVHLSFGVTNKTAVAVSNIDSFYLWAKINTNGTPVLIDAYSQIYLLPGNSMTLTSDLLYLDTTILPQGNYQLYLGIQWKKNPNSGAIVYVYNNFFFSHASGIEETKLSINSLFYSNGNLYFNVLSKIDQNGKLQICNYTGQQIKSFNVKLRAGNEINEVIPLALSDGIYLFSFKSDKSISTQKFIVR